MIVDEGYKIFLPGEIASLRRDNRINLGKVGVGAEHIPNRCIQRKVQQRDAAFIREFV